ncbi:membrane protein [Rhodococcoides trifolii]|uniref:Membrane protein n=1 Tax=Rhodococcoides trifolii TaxID=908250 RepID=A0A917FZK6_9NOCA|nr:thioredoxin domain-containing protein [Rhodococcus trifolii]GGG15339.1 membrane protein [Rhodococcus trifolii]
MTADDRNALGDATSPYLRQHADNPVHWQQWSEAALDRARERDVPILLSIGYSACHWCHVMAHESFEDDDTAALMNENFVSIKVDREERPDIDADYMNATVAMTGQGGWPMTVFLTPDGEPFYCGTYFPRTQFGQLLNGITDAWTSRRAEVTSASAAVVAELRRTSAGVPVGEHPIGQELLDHAVAAVLRDEDVDRGGFGGAPKFPPSNLLEGLVRSFERTGSAAVSDAVDRTAQAMARGGMYDQLRGGFARYSVDADWVVPHFEKMLYDNALLLRFYAHWSRRTATALPRRVAEETAQFLLDDLSTDAGCFASALDADTDGEEGLTYAWTPDQLTEALGFEDGIWAAGLFAVSSAGTFEHGRSVLQLPADPDDLDRFESVRNTLRSIRSARPQPGRDDKVVTAWNGFAITALAEAGAALDKPGWVDAAARCADRLLATHVVDGRLRRASLADTVGDAPGILEDYAALATGLLALHQATGTMRWLRAAEDILDVAVTHCGAEEPGTWFDTVDDAETLFTRPRDPLDGATPAGASLLAEALQAAAALTTVERSARYGEVASATLGRATILLERAPRSAGHWLTVAEAAVRGPLQIAVSTDGPSELIDVARRDAPGGSVVVAGAADSLPLLQDRPLVNGESAAYVCRGFVCDRPSTTVTALRAALQS